ncbi:MAG TPA: AI-2E family transporter, partial [Ilumatobacteraceae bacterium]
WLPTITARVLDLFWTVLIALALLLDGPRLVRAAERRVPAVRRRQFARLVEVSRHAISGYLVGAALVAALNATVVFTIAMVLGVALAPVLAIWAFIWNFVPQIGGFMGGFPLVVLALAAGPMQAVLAGVLFVTYQFIENHLIQPAVISEAIDVPAWATLLAALAGGAAAGVIGAVVLTPLVGVVRVVINEMQREDFPGATVPDVTEGITAAAAT